MSMTDAAFCALARALDQKGGESLAFQMFLETHPDTTEEAFTRAIEGNVHSAVGRLERPPRRSGSGEIVGRAAVRLTAKGHTDRQRLCPPT
jgi:hypothetical protein